MSQKLPTRSQTAPLPTPPAAPALAGDDRDLPEGWAMTSVGECFFDIRNGTTAPQNNRDLGVPVTRIETIQQSRFDLSRVQHLDGVSADFIETFRYNKGDIAFSHINSFEHVGKTALYDGIPHLLIHGMNLLRLRLAHEFVNPRYAHCFMQSIFFRDEVRMRVGHAVNQVSINQKNLSEVPLFLPPLAEQGRIVGKLEEVLGKVAASQGRLARVPGLLKRFRQSILAAACSGKLTADWREGNSEFETDVCSVVLRDMELPPFDVPSDWKWRPLEAICSKITDGEHLTPPRVDSGIPILSAKDVRDSDVDFSDVKFVTTEIAERSRQRCNPECGDILVVSRGATVGRTCRVKTDTTFCLMGSVLLFKPLSKVVLSEFMEYHLKTPTGLAALVGRSGATAQQAIYIRDMRAFPIPLPPLAEQHEIVRRVEQLFALADRIEAQLRAAQTRVDKLTQAVLAKAFRGELVPTEADLARREGRSYEPARELLTRIREQTDATPKARKPRRPKSAE